MSKGERDWAQLDAFEAEYRERLTAEKSAAEKTRRDSQFLTYLNRLARGRETFWSDEVNARDGDSGRLFALRSKILLLREKVGLTDSAGKLLLYETEFAGKTTPDTARSVDDRFDPEGKPLAKKPKEKSIRFVIDPAPEGRVYPVAIDEIKAVLGELPPEYIAPIHEVRLSNQQRTGSDGDWLDGEIRLHCLVQATHDEGENEFRRAMGRRETGADVERWGGRFEWEGTRLFAVWPREAYKTFVLRRVLIHEVAHGVAELPGQADRVRRAGSVEKFCEQYAENFYRPPGKAVRLGF